MYINDPSHPVDINEPSLLTSINDPSLSTYINDPWPPITLPTVLLLWSTSVQSLPLRTGTPWSSHHYFSLSNPYTCQFLLPTHQLQGQNISSELWHISRAMGTISVQFSNNVLLPDPFKTATTANENCISYNGHRTDQWFSAVIQFHVCSEAVMPNQ